MEGWRNGSGTTGGSPVQLVWVRSSSITEGGEACKKFQAGDIDGDPPMLKSVGGIVERGTGNSGELSATVRRRVLYVDV